MAASVAEVVRPLRRVEYDQLVALADSFSDFLTLPAYERMP